MGVQWTQVCAFVMLVEVERLQWLLFPQILQWLFLAKEHVQKANLIMASFSPETRGFVEKPRHTGLILAVHR